MLLTLAFLTALPLLGAHPKPAEAESVPGEVLVRFREDAPVSVATTDAVLHVERFGGSDLVRGLRLVRVPPEDTVRAIDALNARPDVLYAEPNYIWRRDDTPDDPRFADQWALRNTGQAGGVVGADIDADLAWAITTGSSTVIVGVLDSGVDINHADLKDNIWVNPDEIANDSLDNDGNGFVDDVNGWDFHHNDNTVFDNENGDEHATHVAGIIGAKGNNTVGIAGVNWDVRIMSLKVLGPDGGSTSNIINGYNYATMMRARGVNVRVLNNSYGGRARSQAALDAIHQLHEAGILFVTSAGNEATDNFSLPHFPSDYDVPNIISVAATDRFDQLAGFSNFGSRIVSMGAPGRSIWSTNPNQTYSFQSGTSFAAPYVAGVAALALAANPNLSVRQLRGAVAFAGDVVPSLSERTTTGRRLNAFAALQSAVENDTTPPAAPADLQIKSQDGRTVTLTWTAPGDDGNAGSASDYDFFFVSPTGDRILLPTTLLPAAAGTSESAMVTLPLRTFSGGVELRTFDNAGNSSTANVPVTVTVNQGSDPYHVNLDAPLPLTTGGTALNLKSDDFYKENYALPFAFPFFGQERTTVTLSSNGALYFSTPPKRENGDADDAGSSVQRLTGQAMIAGMWDDLRTDAPANLTDDLYVLQPDPDRIIFRWQGVTFDTPLGGGAMRGENPIHFEIELRRDGTIVIRYGADDAAPANTRLFPVVGISAGEPDAYVITSHTATTELTDLTNARTVRFVPRAAPLPPRPRRRAVGR